MEPLASAVHGFPKMFILLGPNSIGTNSVIFSLESQIHYVMSALKTTFKHAVRRIELRPEALEDYVADVDHRSEHSVWTTGGCKAYYLATLVATSASTPASAGAHVASTQSPTS